MKLIKPFYLDKYLERERLESPVSSRALDTVESTVADRNRKVQISWRKAQERCKSKLKEREGEGKRGRRRESKREQAQVNHKTSRVSKVKKQSSSSQNFGPVRESCA